MKNVISLPQDLEHIRTKAISALKELQPAGPPRSNAESKALMLSARTNGGRNLPEYYLVYFLLVDLLGYEDIGQQEKVAWIIPVRYQDRLYSIEHRKFGIGVFAPNHDPAATFSGMVSKQAESDAREISAAINKVVSIAKPYFEWRAKQAASTPHLNVINTSGSLFDRYVFFREQFLSLTEEAERQKDEWHISKSACPDATKVMSGGNPSHQLRRQAKWHGQAAIEAFFGWTEHSFIHLAILQGRLRTGDEVAALAAADWKAKFKAALDLTHPDTKSHYDRLLDLRAQIRNFMAHGAFGKRGEAFHFHSGAGAVPVLLTESQRHRYTLTGRPAFDEDVAIADIETFIEHLWSGSRSPAKIYIFSELPSILTHVLNGTYARAMQSEQDMTDFVDYLTHAFDNAANMDW
ncbi:hypothetical protein [Chromobacterium violaceum]|uniref:hypothetical protein n=1 Tax=Chromobacterium violaceum TaxID=536 RepID=UPI0005D2D8F1|nr:hypothetical protein [Chromobacterium violaceum]KJH69088.1 hypothetical protein UF16_02190 [Chromobacterium violaceum]